MQFKDKYEKADLEYMLEHVFYHVPAGVRTTGDFAGESYAEFWWHPTKGESGYVMVWFDGETFSSFHTYRYPPDINP